MNTLALSGIYALDSDTNSFKARAIFRRAQTTMQFKMGLQVAWNLQRFSQKAALDRVDIFGHSYDEGIIGLAEESGFYLDSKTNVGNGSLVVSSIARAVQDGSIKFSKDCEICFWGCNSFDLSIGLYNALKNVGLTLYVIGVKGKLEPIFSNDGKSELGATASEGFYSFRTGAKKRSRQWGDPKF